MMAFAAEMELLLFQTSVVTGLNIQDMFCSLATSVLSSERVSLQQMSESCSRLVSLDGFGVGRYDPPDPTDRSTCCS